MKYQLSKSFTVVIQCLSTCLIKPNFYSSWNPGHLLFSHLLRIPSGTQQTNYFTPRTCAWAWRPGLLANNLIEQFAYNDINCCNSWIENCNWNLIGKARIVAKFQSCEPLSLGMGRKEKRLGNKTAIWHHLKEKLMKAVHI